MKEISISRFKATCSRVLERVRKTRKPVVITRFGEAVAEVRPPSSKPTKKGRMGCMVGTAKIVGDIVSPATHERDWEMLRS